MLPKEIEKLLVNVPSNIGKEQILELSLDHIKAIPPKARETLEKTLDAKTIGDFAGKVLTFSNIHLLKLLDINENDLEKWQTLAIFLTKFVKGSADLAFKMKILLAGLDNAGKTAILNILMKRSNIASLKPTIDVSIEQLSAENVTFSIWDMGGQEKYRENYMANPERYFINVQSVIYVIDVQDKANYDVSKEYLMKVLDLLESFSEYPDFYIFLHKADPQIYNAIQSDLSALEQMIQNVFENHSFQYHILHTSIYNAILTGENFANSLSNLFELGKNEAISPDLLTNMQLLYNNIIELAHTLQGKLQQFETRLNDFEAQNRQLLEKGESICEEKTPVTPRETLKKEINQLLSKLQVQPP